MDNNTTTNTNTANTQTAEPVNRLYFAAREWSFNKECEDNVGSRSFMQGPDGTITEAFMIGNWGWDWTEIVSKTLVLPKNTLNTFTFWLNGGENDNNNEVCRFEVIFNNDHENRYTYNLNRNFIKPLKKVNGWELYEIPFRTGDNEYTQLRFVAQAAYMTVMTAKDASEYAELCDSVDPFEAYRPQRHNIVFSDGWPNDKWYSTRKMEATYGARANGAPTPQKATVPFEQYIPTENTYPSAISGSIAGINSGLEAIKNFDIDGLRESIKCSLACNPHLSKNDIEELVQSSMEIAYESINEAVESLTESLAELQDTLEDMQS